MYSFKNDYSELAHPSVMEALASQGTAQNGSYGEDDHSLAAAQMIRKHFACPKADVHLLMAGTQTNLTVIAAALRPHQAVISAADGHICVHETGAIEATGHKILPVADPQAKLTPSAIEAVLDEHGGDEHMVQPKLVYLSNATDMGAAYSRAELEALSAFCRAQGLLLYVDGARLGHALMSPGCDLTPGDLARLTDAFYIGGTKNGLLMGEAVVIVNDRLKEDFRFIMKQRGAMMAKGFVLGIQFEALFRDDLYFSLAAHANRLAAKLAEGILALGHRLLCPPQTNMLYPVLPHGVIAGLQKDFDFYVRGYRGETHAAVRLLTSWSTPEAAVDDFLAALKALS